jgi:hypothetical protein
MSTDEDIIRDDDEDLLNTQLGDDAASDADGTDPGDSLKSKTSDPRQAFKDQFTSDETVEEVTEADDEDEGTQEEDVPASELPAKVVEVPKEEENDDEDVDDLGIDFDGIAGVEEEDADDGKPFDPRQDLDKKVWKSTPKEAQQLITTFRRNYKKQVQQVEADKPYAAWTKNLLKDAASVGMNNEDLMAYIDLGLKAHQGQTEAIHALGSRMVQHGYQPAAREVDLSGVSEYLKQQVDSLEMDRDIAVGLMDLVKKTVGSPGVSNPSQQKQASAPRQNPTADAAQIEQLALDAVAEMDKRFQTRFGEKWPALSEKVRRGVILEMAANPVSPAQWPRVWKEQAEKEAKAHLARVKAAKKSQSKLRSDSDSIGRGASIVTDESGQQLTGRAAFHKRHTR